MVWKLLADASALLHGLNVAFIIFGPFFAWRWRRVRLIYLITLWFNFVIASTGVYCPMTSVENALRAHYDPSTTYATGFVVRYVGPLLWWDLTQRHVVIAMMGWALLWTVVYLWLWKRPSGPSA